MAAVTDLARQAWTMGVAFALSVILRNAMRVMALTINNSVPHGPSTSRIEAHVDVSRCIVALPNIGSLQVDSIIHSSAVAALLRKIPHTFRNLSIIETDRIDWSQHFNVPISSTISTLRSSSFYGSSGRFAALLGACTAPKDPSVLNPTFEEDEVCEAVETIAPRFHRLHIAGMCIPMPAF